MRSYRALPTLLGLLVIAAAAISIVGSPVPHAGVAARRHGPIIIHERHGKNLVDSTNWGGYAVTGANGSVMDAKGSWVVPSVTCGTTDTYAAFWVGIDGYNSNTVEQIGSDSDCVSGQAQYYIWFEFYPHFSYTVGSLPLKPGDVVSAEVQYNGKKGQFTVSATVNPASHGPSFSTSTKLNQAQQSSAEWIIEAPYSGGVLPLSDFNSISYGSDYTGVSATCDASIGKTTGGIGAFGTEVVAITMVDKNGLPKAIPSTLSKDQSSFTDAWQSAGP